MASPANILAKIFQTGRDGVKLYALGVPAFGLGLTGEAVVRGGINGVSELSGGDGIVDYTPHISNALGSIYTVPLTAAGSVLGDSFVRPMVDDLAKSTKTHTIDAVAKALGKANIALDKTVDSSLTRVDSTVNNINDKAQAIFEHPVVQTGAESAGRIANPEESGKSFIKGILDEATTNPLKTIAILGATGILPYMAYDYITKKTRDRQAQVNSELLKELLRLKKINKKKSLIKQSNYNNIIKILTAPRKMPNVVKQTLDLGAKHPVAAIGFGSIPLLYPIGAGIAQDNDGYTPYRDLVHARLALKDLVIPKDQESYSDIFKEKQKDSVKTINDLKEFYITESDAAERLKEGINSRVKSVSDTFREGVGSIKETANTAANEKSSLDTDTIIKALPVVVGTAAIPFVLKYLYDQKVNKERNKDIDESLKIIHDIEEKEKKKKKKFTMETITSKVY